METSWAEVELRGTKLRDRRRVKTLEAWPNRGCFRGPDSFRVLREATAPRRRGAAVWARPPA